MQFNLFLSNVFFLSNHLKFFACDYIWMDSFSFFEIIDGNVTHFNIFWNQISFFIAWMRSSTIVSTIDWGTKLQIGFGSSTTFNRPSATIF